MKKAIIGVLGNTWASEKSIFPNMDRAYANRAYIDAVSKNGGAPLLVPYIEDKDALESVLQVCDGILLPGGEDISPELYGEEPSRKLGVIRPEIDRFWVCCVKYAAAHELPVLGICKGMQLLNAVWGGSLYQDLSLRESDSMVHMQKSNRSCPTHAVAVEKGSSLERILGTDVINTNSMHHQSVHALGKEFTAAAHTSDGVIEAIENIDKNIFAVQWHPEELTESVPEMNRLFQWLVEKAGERKIQSK